MYIIIYIATLPNQVFRRAHRGKLVWYSALIFINVYLNLIFPNRAVSSIKVKRRSEYKDLLLRYTERDHRRSTIHMRWSSVAIPTLDEVEAVSSDDELVYEKSEAHQVPNRSTAKLLVWNQRRSQRNIQNLQKDKKLL